jgi:hypothetical protein
MFQLIQRYALITDTSGKVYRPAAYGAPQDDLTWSGWLVFFPLSAGAAVATTRETTQSSRDALAAWAAAISAVYLQGALERALELQPEAALAAQLRGMEQLESEAEGQAEVLERAASVARRTAEIAAERRAETAKDLTNAAAEAARTSAILHEETAAASRAEAEILERQALEYEKNAAAAQETTAAADASAHEDAARQARARRRAARRRRQVTAQASTTGKRLTRSHPRASAKGKGRG